MWWEKRRENYERNWVVSIVNQFLAFSKRGNYCLLKDSISFLHVRTWFSFWGVRTELGLSTQSYYEFENSWKCTLRIKQMVFTLSKVCLQNNKPSTSMVLYDFWKWNVSLSKNLRKMYELDNNRYIFNSYFHQSPAYSSTKLEQRNLTAKNERITIDSQSFKLKF